MIPPAAFLFVASALFALGILAFFVKKDLLTQFMAVEVMLNTPRIAELVQRGDISKVKESFAESTEQGMQSFDQALLRLYKDGKIPMEEALASADSRTNLEAKIHFG